MEHSLIWTGFLASLAAGAMTGVGALPVFLPFRFTARVQDVLLGFAAGVMLAASAFSLIVPGLVLLTWWAVIVPVVVLENKSAGEAFSRSRQLVRGYGWGVFGVIVLVVLLIVVNAVAPGIIQKHLDSESPDTAETIDCDFNCHERTPVGEG